MKKVVVLVELIDLEQDKKFEDYVSSMGWGYWHWIDGAWLITKHEDSTAVTELIRDKLSEIAPGKRTFVFEISALGTWSGFGPNSESKDMFKWIREHWKS